eukprot:CAMPEP_0194282598 /NCGR_PEP_ID=MMETSP0169-20130528/23490_1 /TAXON_ID=218684 /ORGANISM="Corethron pennatum, Strain L29A3" /LENGTH=660 /DNA_ID=CAMNT_0039027977 /DNA_START=242 /DNA_END=2224 /DNA_ORIENTATION=+
MARTCLFLRTAVMASLIFASAHGAHASDKKPRRTTAWTPEKSRQVADAWFEEQRRLGLNTEIDVDSTIFGVDSTEYASNGLNPREAFDVSELSEFPDSEFDNAANKLRLDKIAERNSQQKRESGTSSIPEFRHSNTQNEDKLRKKTTDPVSPQRRMWTTYYNKNKADITEDIDWFAQGYRMLGGFIDCSHSKDGGHGSQSGDDGVETNPCSRWMMWAAYSNPNYEGGGWEEYYDGDDDTVSCPDGYIAYNGTDDFYTDHANDNGCYKNSTDDGYDAKDYGNGDGDDIYRRLGDDQYNSNGKTGDDIDYAKYNKRLDCHKDSTDWVLIGVYRQEFYQFIEQLSKHLWAIDSYEYITAIAGLAYMTDDDCSYVGSDNDGNYLYAGPKPLPWGSFMIGIYLDDQCLLSTSDYNFDDFGLTSELDLDLDDDSTYVSDDLYDYWSAGQEQTLSNLNSIMNTFKMCRLCMDFPTYQDGYFIGTYGTDDYSLINQCWKFHSHDSFTCNADCIQLGHKQGTIVKVSYGGKIYGGSTEYNGNIPYINEGTFSRNLERIESNIFIAFSSIIFVSAALALWVTLKPVEFKGRKSKRSSMMKFASDNKKITKSDSNSRKKVESSGRGYKLRSTKASQASQAGARKKQSRRSKRAQSGMQEKKYSNYNPPEIT